MRSKDVATDSRGGVKLPPKRWILLATVIAITILAAYFSKSSPDQRFVGEWRHEPTGLSLRLDKRGELVGLRSVKWGVIGKRLFIRRIGGSFLDQIVRKAEILRWVLTGQQPPDASVLTIESDASGEIILRDSANRPFRRVKLQARSD